ncbi:MAG: GC-type dockerin domain-anchored protein [Phycisphaerales bacterium]
MKNPRVSSALAAAIGMAALANVTLAEERGVATGACCYNNGLSCLDTDRANCENNLGGIYEGDGTTCVTTLCPIVLTGACCFGQTCIDGSTQSNCVTGGGRYLGDGTTCFGIGLCPTTGTCCINLQCFDNYTEAECFNANGTSFIPFNTCASGGSCPAVGACCVQFNGTCTDNIAENDCLFSLAGVFQGNATTCATLPNGCQYSGACCLTNGSCFDSPPFDCANFYFGTYLGLGTNCATAACPPATTGACCSFGKGYFCQDNVLPENCTGTLNTFYGVGSLCGDVQCPPVGACCIAQVGCLETDIINCQNQGGSYLGNNTNCAGSVCPSACCLPNASCVQVASEAECAQQGGVFSLNATCATTCCLPDCTVRAVLSQVPMKVFTSSYALADINLDGFNDIIIVENTTATTPGNPGQPNPSTLLEQATGNPLDAVTRYIDAVARHNQQPERGFGTGNLVVHALSGAANFNAELPGWPVNIGTSSFDPTVAVGDINFDNKPDVLVGGLVSGPGGATCSVFAIRADSTPTPGWECVQSFAPPFFNAPSFGDVNADGAPDLLMCDESTFYHRYQALGRIWQCQFITDPVHSSPAWGDLGRGPVSAQGQPLGDGLPDAYSAGEGPLQPQRVYDTFGTTLNCSGLEDLLFNIGPNERYFSSPALADLDRDGTQDVVITSTPAAPASPVPLKLSVYASSLGVGTVTNFILPTGPAILNNAGTLNGLLAGYSSPAVVDLDNDGERDEIVVGSDSGRVHAFKYIRTNPSATRLVEIPGWEGGVQLDANCFGLSSSPVVADLIGDSKPEVVCANDAGRVHILSSSGAKLRSYCCYPSGWVRDAAIFSTAVVGSRKSGETPVIAAGNRLGTWIIRLNADPVFNPARAQWPTFHRDNARTGSLGDYVTIPQRGSIGGRVPSCAGGTFIELLDGAGTPVPDPRPASGFYTTTSVSDGRFVFDMLDPGNYQVKINLVPTPLVIPVTVVAGQMRFYNRCCPADLNNDGAVNTIDLTAFLGQFGTTRPPYTGADFNGDGSVNTIDLTFFLGQFGRICP